MLPVEKNDYDGHSMLLCPKCGDVHTHVDSVWMHVASHKGVKLTAAGEDGGATYTVEESGDDMRPSWHNFRRHSITLMIWCEQGCVSWLDLVQHKGSTYMKLWPDSDSAAEPEHQFGSPVEQQFWDAYRASTFTALHGLTPQHEVPPYRLDFAIPHKQFGIEVDGLAYHNGQASFIADRKRQRALEAAGWRIIRFAAKEVMQDAAGCVRQAAALAART